LSVEVTWWSVDVEGLRSQSFRRLDELLASPSERSARQRNRVSALLGGARVRQPIKRELEIPLGFDMVDFSARLDRWRDRSRAFKGWAEAAAEGPAAAIEALHEARVLAPWEREQLGDWLRPPGAVTLSPEADGALEITQQSLRRLKLSDATIHLSDGHVLLLDGPYTAELVLTARLAVRGRGDPMWPWRGVDPLPGGPMEAQNEAVDWAAWHGRGVLAMLSWLPVCDRRALLSLTL